MGYKGLITKYVKHLVLKNAGFNATKFSVTQSLVVTVNSCSCLFQAALEELFYYYYFFFHLGLKD